MVKLLTTPELKRIRSRYQGFFFAAAAGFQPHGLQGFINRKKKIYSTYKLADIQKGYPSKQERIVIAKMPKILQHNSMNILKTDYPH